MPEENDLCRPPRVFLLGHGRIRPERGTFVSPEEAKRRIEALERDRSAWTLPSPPPEHVQLPPEENWPPWPFVPAHAEEPLEPGS
jgi:hypothetical protein